MFLRHFLFLYAVKKNITLTYVNSGGVKQKNIYLPKISKTTCRYLFVK